MRPRRLALPARGADILLGSCTWRALICLNQLNKPKA
jgi:hypothetical protein